MKYIFPACLLFVVACSEEQQPEVISLEDLTGETGPEEVTNDSVTIESSFGSTVVGQFVQGQMAQYDTASMHAPHPMDRFGYSTFHKFDFIAKTQVADSKEGMVTPVASFYYYSFPDTTSAKNAFYNWLDCFGENCDAVQLNRDMEEIKTTPMFTFIYDTCIVAVEYACEHKKNDWKSFQDSIIERFGKNYNYRIEVACNGPLKWKPAKAH